MESTEDIEEYNSRSEFEYLYKNAGHVKLSSEMENILNNKNKNKNIHRSEILEDMSLTHIIIKNVQEDRKLQALTIARRLLYCCPLHHLEKNNGTGN